MRHATLDDADSEAEHVELTDASGVADAPLGMLDDGVGEAAKVTDSGGTEGDMETVEVTVGVTDTDKEPEEEGVGLVAVGLVLRLLLIDAVCVVTDTVKVGDSEPDSE